MSKEPKQFRWEISRIAAKAKYVGSIYAPDEQAALKKAATELNVPAALESRLVARRAE